MIYDKGLLKKQFMQELLDGKLRSRDLKELNEKYATEFRCGKWMMLVIKPDEKKTIQHEQYLIVLEKIEVYFNTIFSKAFFETGSISTDEMVYFVINFAENCKVRYVLEDAFSQAKQNFFDFVSLTMGISEIQDDLQIQSVAQVRKTIISRIDRGINRILEPEPFDGDDRKVFYTAEEKYKFRQSIEVADVARLEDLFAEFYRKGSYLPESSYAYIRCIHELISEAVAAVKRLYRNDSMEIGEKEVRTKLIHCTQRRDKKHG